MILTCSWDFRLGMTQNPIKSFLCNFFFLNCKTPLIVWGSITKIELKFFSGKTISSKCSRTNFENLYFARHTIFWNYFYVNQNSHSKIIYKKFIKCRWFDPILVTTLIWINWYATFLNFLCFYSVNLLVWYEYRHTF